MTTPFRVFEIILYTFINFLPYFFLAIYPFHEKFRFSKAVNICLFTVLSILEIMICVWASLFSPDNTLTSFLNTFFYALFFFIAIKVHPGKLLFVLLMVSNIANQIVFSAKCLEGILFPALAPEAQHWSFSLTTVICQVVFLPFFFLFLKKHFREAVAVQLQTKIWNYLWLIPGTFYLFWFYLAYFISFSGIYLALRPVCTIIAILINSGALLIYYTITKMVHEFDTNIELRTQNDLLTIQNLQYKNLKERMDETKRARHDLRQHMITLHSLCTSGEYEKLTTYLQNYLNQSSTDHPLFYCDNLTLNALLIYYVQIAEKRKIDFSINISLPKEIPIQDTDLCVLLGNLIENACDGCMTQPEDNRHIRLEMLMLNCNSIVLSLDNTFEGQPPLKNCGQFLSSKHGGYGIGLDSVLNIVNRYNGDLKIDTKEGMFCTSVVFYL